MDTLRWLLPRHLDVLGRKGTENEQSTYLVNDWLPINMKVRRNQGREVVYLDLPEESAQDLFPRMPFGEKHIRLHLTNPKALQEIRLNNMWLKSAKIYVTAQIPMDYDNVSTWYEATKFYPLGRKKGEMIKFSLEDYPHKEFVNTVVIIPEFDFDTKDMSEYQGRLPLARF